ncbi:hypothetical protein HFO58_31940 [Rhizobium leguminosarum]|uniref:hypothetical protein n=1 Tax=Rhizobium leguminosarum TaxID=384 RepID=UPI001C93DF26|nr:hypothetical protein [Rhizobium leguminosarum]MBY5537705.1 hypothetical protein [Rhizobium leguminosarum]
MNFPYLARLAEIQHRLGPTLKELGVKAQYFRNDDGERGICFRNKCETVVCPVEIFFGSGAAKGWEGSFLVQEHFTSIEIGNSGWVHYRDDGYEDRFALGADTKAAFAQIESVMREARIVHRYDGKNKIISKSELGDAYQSLDELLCVDLDVSFDVRREGDTESIAFTDPYGDTKWVLVFGSADSRVFADNVQIAVFRCGRVSEMMKFVCDKITGADIVEAHLRELGGP